MPPKVKISKEDIINATIDLVRLNGYNAINARAIAKYLNCSTQPIFSNFTSMNELLYSVIEKVYFISKDYEKKEIEKNLYPVYKATGMAYIRFAKEEKELFKLLYMRDRTNEINFNNFGFDNDLINIVMNTTGLNEDKSKLFHLEMWAYVHGIATMFATGFLNLDWELVNNMITDMYQGLRNKIN